LNRAAVSRVTVFVLSLALLLVFSGMTVETLAAFSFGAAIMLMGLVVYYRLAAVVGMLVTTTSAACCMTLGTMTEVRLILASLLGLVLPAAMLAWLAMTAESGSRFRPPGVDKPFILSGLYLLLCIVSVPLVVTVTGLMFPSMVSRLEGFAEISVVLLVAAFGAVSLGSAGSRSSSRRGRAPRRQPTKLTPLAAAIIIAALVVAGPTTAEIPHEDYDLVNPDMELIVVLLRTTVDHAEQCMESLLDERIEDAYQNLSVVDGLIGPAEELVDDMAGIAASYDDLVSLTPPFSVLSVEVRKFADMEAQLIEVREDIRTLAGNTVLTPEEASLAVVTINDATSLITVMNTTLDNIQASGQEISSLVVDDETPFAENDFDELVDGLRAWLQVVEAELTEFIDGSGSGDDPWAEVEPFLTLWLADLTVYLGESVSGGGYLFYDGAFRPGHDISVMIDGLEVTTSLTGEYGRYAFSYKHSAEAEWLGSHVAISSVNLYFGLLESRSIDFVATTIPTRVELGLAQLEFAPDEMLTVVVGITDVRSRPVPNASCLVQIDSRTIELQTDPMGLAAWSDRAGSLDYGDHVLRAEYEGVLPFASSASEDVVFTVSVPTRLELDLASSRLRAGALMVGDGRLVANLSDPLQGMPVGLSLDGTQMLNVTTGADGAFSFAMETLNLSVGTHVISAEFLGRSEVLRYCINETAFTLTADDDSDQFPFWPFIPGWSGGPPEAVYNVFFGEFAYVTWLAIVIVVVAMARTVRTRRAVMQSRVEAASRPRKAAQPSMSAAALRPEEMMMASLIEGVGPPGDPNSRIVWEYRRLVSYLASRRMIALRASMTHREIAKVLGTLGYPKDVVDQATGLFEAAFYSGRRLSVSDMERMVESVSVLRRVGGGGVGRVA